MDGQGVRSLYGPASNAESEGWEVVDQEDRTAPPASNRQTLSINPHAEVDKPFFPARVPTKNAVPSHVVDDLLAEHQRIHGKPATLDLYADDADDAGGAWGTDSPSNLLGSDEMDYDDEASPAKVQTSQTSAWDQQVEFSPREPPAGAFGDDDLDLDDDDDERETAAAPSHELSPQPSPVAAVGPSFDLHTSSPFSQSAEAPEGAFGDDDLDLDDDDDEDQVEESAAVTEQVDEVLNHPVESVEQLDVPEVHIFSAAPVEFVPKLNAIPVSPRDAPAGAFGDDDLDLDDDDVVDETSVAHTHVEPAEVVASAAETDVPEVLPPHIDTLHAHHPDVAAAVTESSPEESPKNRDTWATDAGVDDAGAADEVFQPSPASLHAVHASPEESHVQQELSEFEASVEGLDDAIDLTPTEASSFQHHAEAVEPEESHSFDLQRDAEVPETQPLYVDEVVQEHPEAEHAAPTAGPFDAAVEEHTDATYSAEVVGDHEVAPLQSSHGFAVEHHHEPVQEAAPFHQEAVESVVDYGVDEEETSLFDQDDGSSPFDSTPESHPSPFEQSSPEHVVEETSASSHVEVFHEGHHYVQHVSAPEIHATPPSSADSTLHASPEALESTFVEEASPFDQPMTYDHSGGFFAAPHETQPSSAAAFASGYDQVEVPAVPSHYEATPSASSVFGHGNDQHAAPTSDGHGYVSEFDAPSDFADHQAGFGQVPEFDAPPPTVFTDQHGQYETASPFDQHHERYEGSPFDQHAGRPQSPLATRILSAPAEFAYEQSPQDAHPFSDRVHHDSPEQTTEYDRPHSAEGLFGESSGDDGFGVPASAFDAAPQQGQQHQYHEPTYSYAQETAPPTSADELFSSSPDFGLSGSSAGAFDAAPPPPVAFASVDAHFSNPTNYHSAPHPTQQHGVDDFFSTVAPSHHDLSSQFHSVGHDAADLFGGQANYSNDPFGDPFAAPAHAAHPDQHSADGVFAQGHVAAGHQSASCGYEQHHPNFPPPAQHHQDYSTPFEAAPSAENFGAHSFEQPPPPQQHAAGYDHGAASVFGAPDAAHAVFGAPDAAHSVFSGHDAAAHTQAVPPAAQNYYSEPTPSFEQSTDSADSFFGQAPAHFATEPVPSAYGHDFGQYNDGQQYGTAEENYGFPSHEHAVVDQGLAHVEHSVSEVPKPASPTHPAEAAHSVAHDAPAALRPEVVHSVPPPDHHSRASTAAVPPAEPATSAPVPRENAPPVYAAPTPPPPQPSPPARTPPKLQIEDDDDVPTADSLFSPTNGNEISNVFGSTSAFDQPPSSLGGFSNSHAATMFSRVGGSAAVEAFAAAPAATFQASPFTESAASEPFGHAASAFDTSAHQPTEAYPAYNQSTPEATFEDPADLFAGSSSASPFDQHQAFASHPSEPFGQSSYHQPVPAAQVFGGNYAEPSQYDQSAAFHQPEGHPAAAPYAQSYSRSTSHASAHFDEPAATQSYASYPDQQGYGSSAASTFNQAAVSHDGHAQGYDAQSSYGQQQHGAYGGYTQGGGGYQQPGYHQPVAQTFDQPAAPSYPQTPGHGFAQPGYAQQPQYAQYDQYNQQGSQQQYGQQPHGYNQAEVVARPAKPAIFKPQPAQAQPVAYEQHAPRMSRELKQQYQPATPTPQHAPAVFNPAPKPQAGNRPKDPSVVPRSCLATFGFGGTVCVMFPRRKLKLLSAVPRNSPRPHQGSPSFDEHIDDSRKGPLDFYKLDRLHHDSDVFYQKVRSFPGPLAGSSTSDDAILKFMGGQVSVHEDERLLWDLMQVFVKSKGKVSTRDAKASDMLLMQSLQNSLARRTSSLPPYDAVSPSVVQASADGTDATNAKIRQLLLDGDRKAAIDAAVAANMWSQAMLLASFVDSDMYKSVVEAFVTSRYGVGDPLRTMLMVFGDLDVKSVQEPPPPQKLMHTPSSSSFPEPPAASSLLGNWLAQVQILIANPTINTNKVLVELGDRLLRETSNVWAAHTCFMLAGVPLEAPAPNARMTLIGGHATGDVRFFVRPNTVQWTEVYEHVLKPTPMVAFQGYKFIYATLLADAGCCDVAFKYVDAMRKTLDQWLVKQKMPSSPYLDNLKTQLDVFDDRLRFFMGQENVDAAEVQVSKKGGLFSSLTGFLDKTLDKIVNDTPPPPAKTVSAPIAGTAFAPHMFPPAPGSNNAPGSHNSRAAPNSSSSNQQFYQSAPGSQNSHSNGYAPSPGSQNGYAPSPGSQNGYTPSPGSQQQQGGSGFGFDAPGSQHEGSSAWTATPPPAPSSQHSGPPGSTSGNSMLPPRPQTSATTASAPPSAQPHPHPPLKKSSSFTMDSKPHADTTPATKDDLSADSTAATPKAKTPPTSSSQKKSGWGFPSLSLPSLGLVDMLRRSADPVGDATVAKVGKDMEAYYCEEKKRWVFPGEEDAEDTSGPPPPPPTSFAAAAAQAPASTGAASNDPLASLMAPPPIKETTPLAAMMAPPARSMYGSQRGGAPAAKRAPPRPQFAVFKPSAVATPAPSNDDAAAPSSENGSFMPPPPPGSSGGQ